MPTTEAICTCGDPESAHPVGGSPGCHGCRAFYPNEADRLVYDKETKDPNSHPGEPARCSRFTPRPTTP